jgi:threonine aldolase
VVARLGERGVRVGAIGAGRIRAVTHLEVDDAGIDGALAAFREVLGGR